MGFKFEDQQNYSNVWFNPDYNNANHCGDRSHHRDDLDDVRDRRNDRDDNRKHNQDDLDDVRGRRNDRDDNRKHDQDDLDDVRGRRDGGHDDKKRPWLFTL